MKTIESYKHLFAKAVLRDWLGGEYDIKIEQPFKIDGKIAFVPDVACFSGGALIKAYEVVNKSPVGGKKLGFMQSWAYHNFTGFTCHEISADYIMAQIDKPDLIKTINTYEIYPHERKDIKDTA